MLENDGSSARFCPNNFSSFDKPVLKLNTLFGDTIVRTIVVSLTRLQCKNRKKKLKRGPKPPSNLKISTNIRTRAKKILVRIHFSTA